MTPPSQLSFEIHHLPRATSFSRRESPRMPILRLVAPVAYHVILEPGIGQFLEFEPRQVHTHKNSWVRFPVHKMTCGKRESVS